MRDWHFAGVILGTPLKQPHSRANVLVSGWHFVMRTAFCSNTHVRKHFCRTYRVPPRWAQKSSNKSILFRDCKKENMGQIWFQNLSIAIQAVRFDRFCCPIALTIAVKKIWAALLSNFFCDYMRLLFLIQMYPILLRSCSFCPIVSFKPKFKESMLRVPFSHKAQIRCVIGILQGWFLEPPLKQPHSRANVLVSGWHLSCALHFVVTPHVHKHFVEPTASPPDEPKKVRTNPFYLETVRRKIWDRFGFKTYQLQFKLCALTVFVAP